MSTTRTCPSCGTEASPNERFCANCGTRLAEQAAVAPTVHLGGQGPAPIPPPQGPLPGGAPATPPRRGLPVWAIILLSLVGLCAIACIAGFVFLNVVGQRVIQEAGTAVVALATAQPTLAAALTPEDPSGPAPTSNVILVLPTKAPTQGGGGVLGGGASGAGAQVQTAEAATAVAADTTAADALFASATQVFRDEFVDNSNSWFTGQVSDIETDRIEDGVFKVIWTGKGTTYEPYVERQFANFIAELDCKAQQGGSDAGCGLIFGEETDVGFYKFEVYEDYYGLYAVPLEEGVPALVEGDPAGIVRPGDWNRLRVVRQGDTISVYLNGTLLGSASDTTYPGGNVGVSTSSFNEAGGVEVWFDNLTIWELPS